MKLTTLLKTITFGLLFSFGISTISLYADEETVETATTENAVQAPDEQSIEAQEEALSAEAEAENTAEEVTKE